MLRYLLEGKSSEYQLQAITAMLDHDVPEALLGDTPHPTKKIWDVMADAVADSEDAIVREYKLSGPEGAPMAIDCKAADLLEMAYFALRQVTLGNGSAMKIIGAVAEAMGAIKAPTKANDMLIVIIEEIQEVLGVSE